MIECDKLFKEQILISAEFRCELCGGDFRVTAHHFFPRGLYGHVKYLIDNGVALDFPCHFAHHHRGDPKIHEKIIANRGRKWYNHLRERAYTKPKPGYLNINYYNNIIKELEL